MRIPVIRHGQIAALAYGIGLAGAFIAAAPGIALAITPKSPDVVAAIKRGIEFLESNEANDDRIGARALQGMCLLNHTANRAHPKIVQAVERIQKALEGHNPAKLDTGAWDIYSVGLAIMFLVELEDREKYGPDIECLLTHLRSRQKPHGGWGYPNMETGDTSMTQYGVLSSWMAASKGFAVPQESMEAVATWLLRTQDPSGGFGYQGNVAPVGGPPATQTDVRPSMTAAASGSLYICAEFLGLVEKQEKRKDLPSAMKEVKDKNAPKEKPRTKIEVRAIREAEAHSKQWLEANTKLEGMQWTHYYLYALERYMAARDNFEHRTEAEPQWYNENAAFLMKTQGANGSWSGQGGAVPDTAFSVLFLMRNTRKIFEVAARYKGGIMISGHGIPKETEGASIDSKGNLVVKPLSNATASLLDAIEKPDSRDFDKSVDMLGNLPGNQLEILTAKYGDKIRELVGNKSPEARLAAVRALGKARDLDNVETLIYALTDPDPQVVRAANEGLLRIRRASTGPTLPETFSEDDRRLLVEKWKAWFQSIRPGVDMR